MFEICLDQDESDTWYKIFCKQDYIGINHSVDDDEFYSEENPLFVFSQMNGVEFVNQTAYMDEIKNDNSKVLNNPCGAFILNVDDTKADEIQSRFGVICQSSYGMNHKSLTLSDATFTTLSPGSWTKRMPFGKVLPSNSLILVDRYLFCSDTGETLQDSYDNIEDMMEAFMPDYFDSEYHLCIIFDANILQDRDIKILLNCEKSRDFSYQEKEKAFAEISAKLNIIKNKFEKRHKYTVILEVLNCDRRDKESYDKTHDRTIISNYFYATASHKLKAYRNGQPMLKQKIDILPLYSKGLSGISDIPVYAHTDDIKDLRYIVNESKKHPILHKYSFNGDNNLSINNFKNRILI